ncbi:hypothetical protein phiK7A1_021c [Pseudomonas phage phiK7A1]|uniref:Uncharacterized protein n=1 Tax=Pseudomonas phage phiK7A1 TaxID=2759194 RepID=A0A7H0XFM1_9CAUD|nr:hypothetical protein phiK7A1_021c [Pseudomonas phage phiK7A1]
MKQILGYSAAFTLWFTIALAILMWSGTGFGLIVGLPVVCFYVAVSVGIVHKYLGWEL